MNMRWGDNFERDPVPLPPVAPIRDVIDVYKASPFLTRWTDQIIRYVELEFGVTGMEMKGKSRKRRVAEARFAAIHLIRKYRQYSYHKIGQMFGKRDHTTIISALKRVAELEAKKPSFREKLQAAESKLIGDDTSKVWPTEIIQYLHTVDYLAGD